MRLFQPLASPTTCARTQRHAQQVRNHGSRGVPPLRRCLVPGVALRLASSAIARALGRVRDEEALPAQSKLLY